MLETRAKTMRTVPTGPLWRIASARMPTKWGMFDAVGFERDVSNGTPRFETALAIVMSDLTEGVVMRETQQSGVADKEPGSRHSCERSTT
jgi:hypothetical protein